MLLYEDETILWRFALPRVGWWRKGQRARLPIRPLSQGQIKREEVPQTPGVGMLSLLEPCPQWSAAQRYWGGSVWDLQSFL
jgi:hypothetical protein